MEEGGGEMQPAETVQLSSSRPERLLLRWSKIVFRVPLKGIKTRFLLLHLKDLLAECQWNQRRVCEDEWRS